MKLKCKFQRFLRPSTNHGYSTTYFPSSAVREIALVDEARIVGCAFGAQRHSRICELGEAVTGVRLRGRNLMKEKKWDDERGHSRQDLGFTCVAFHYPALVLPGHEAGSSRQPPRAHPIATGAKQHERKRTIGRVRCRAPQVFCRNSTTCSALVLQFFSLPQTCPFFSPREEPSDIRS